MGKTTAHILVIAMLAALVAVAFMRVNYTWNWDGVWEYRQKFIQGWVTTLVLSVAALVGSIVIGMVAAMMLQSRREFVQALARVYVELVRGTPLLVQLLIGFYVVASAVGLDNRFVVGVLSLSLFSGAYMAEIFRGGLAAIPQTQRDAARAIGLSQWQSMRLVILPQALRLVLPPIAGQLVSLIKDSSLLSVIAISEFTLNAQEVNSFTYSALESYLPLAAGYLMLTLPLSWLARLLESRFRYET
ncbi:MAG: amino acid ABC transporter permease [Planctomycetota bacterium]|nr:MAG: amino acid ABC transporter permease [Planctomycetota bacterium]